MMSADEMAETFLQSCQAMGFEGFLEAFAAPPDSGGDGDSCSVGIPADHRGTGNEAVEACENRNEGDVCSAGDLEFECRFSQWEPTTGGRCWDIQEGYTCSSYAEKVVLEHGGDEDRCFRLCELENL